MTSVLLSILPIALDLSAKIVVIGWILVRARGRPTARLTWIVVILAVPLLGVILYLLVGEVRLGRRRRRRHQAIVERIQRSQSLMKPDRDHAAPEVPDEHRQISILAEAVGNCIARGGNAIELIGDTDELIGRLVADIDAAARHCHLLFYVILDDASGRLVTEALSRAAARGVECRLLIDAVGSSIFAGSRTRRRLEATGVRVVEALPTSAIRMLFARIDLRNHRKIAVIDDSIGYLGSHNLAGAAFDIKPAYAPWVDATVRVTGPVAHDLQVLFIEDWFLDTDESLEHVLEVRPEPRPGGVCAQVMGTGPSSFNAALRQLIHMAIHQAREEVVLTTPYFVPDDATLTAIRTAARSGVRTRLVLPARNDSPLVAAASRSNFEPLLADGVEVFEFTEGLLHAKTLCVDRNLALIGSANLDRRSFELNLEISLLVFNSDFASQLRFLQQSYLDRSRRVEAAAWARRRWPTRLIQNAAGTMAPLL